MQDINFLVQGSASEPYKVTFRKSGNNFTALCTCPAGKNNLYCKHRFNILEGNTNNIVSGNENDVSIVVKMLPGTDIENALYEVKNTERELNDIKKKLADLKKKLARVMLD